MKSVDKKKRLSVGPWSCLLLLVLFISVMIRTCLVAQSKRPIVSGELSIISEKYPIQPQFATCAPDGNCLIGGTEDNYAWAALVGKDRKLKWTYVDREAMQDETAHAESYFESPHTEYSGAIFAPDGSLFLCRNLSYMKVQESKPFGAFFCHISQDGHLIKNLPIIPSNGAARQVPHLNYIAKSGQDFILLGTQFHVYSVGAATKFYWVLKIDPEGNIVWEKQIPSLKTQFNVQEIGFPQIQADSGLVFSATDNYQTELVSLSSTGDVVAQKFIAGGFQLVAPAVADKETHLFGFRDSTISLVAFDEVLNETQAIEVRALPILMRKAFRSTDGSIVVAGSTENMFGESYTSRVSLFSPNLKNESFIEFSRNGKPVSDQGSIWAATLGSEPNTLIVARSFSVPSQTVKAFPPVSKRGVLVDFLALEPMHRKK